MKKLFWLIFLLFNIDSMALPALCNDPSIVCKDANHWNSDPTTPITSADVKRAIIDARDGFANVANIDNNVSFDYLYFPAPSGPINYPLDERVRFTGQLKMIGDPDVTLWASPVNHTVSDELKKYIDVKAPNNEIDIRNLRFENLSLRIDGRIDEEDTTRVTSIHFENNHFKNQETRALIPQSSYSSGNWDHHVTIYHASKVTIRNNEFVRDISSFGRGVFLQSVYNVDISNNDFKGYYVTAMNIIGIYDNGLYSSQNINIVNNNIHRHDGASFPEDHGLYAWGYYNLLVENNNFSGWSSTACGMAINAKNAKRTIIKNNKITDSGILVAVDASKEPQLLENTYIHGNIIGLNGRTILHDLSYCGDNYQNLSIYYSSDSGVQANNLYVYDNIISDRIVDTANNNSITQWNNLKYVIVDTSPDWRCATISATQSIWYQVDAGISTASIFNGTCQNYGKVIGPRLYSRPSYPGWACFNYLNENKSFWFQSSSLPLLSNHEGDVNFPGSDYLNGSSFNGKCTDY
jgi:hypothetical protein